MLPPPFLILPALLMCISALAQDAPYGGEWICTGRPDSHPLVAPGDSHTQCFVQCNDNETRHDVGNVDSMYRQDVGDYPAVRCPTEELNAHVFDTGACSAFFQDEFPPVCFPPGTHPDEFVIPEQKFHERALLAFGVAFAAGVAVNALAPHLPEGLSLVPEVRAAYRDGLMMTSAELTADWRKWTVSASAVNFQGEWSRPYARVQWTWAF